MLNTIRTQNQLDLTDAEIANKLVNCLPTDDEGALFWS